MKINALTMIAAPLALAAVLSGCGKNEQSAAALGAADGIAASDQAAGSALTVASARVLTNGWIVVHTVRDGKPDVSTSIGHAYIARGLSENVTVPLTEPQPPGSEVVVMLHLDTGAARVFEFANDGLEKNDGPILRDGKPVMVSIGLN